MSNNNLPQQSLNSETFVKLDDNNAYDGSTNNMNESMYPNQQQEQPSIDLSLSAHQEQEPQLVESTTIINTPLENPQQHRNIIETMEDSLNNLVNVMSIATSPNNAGSRNNAYLQPTFNSSTLVSENPETVYEYTLDAVLLDCQMVHPTQLGQTSCRINFELMIQHKTIPNLSHKVNRGDMGGSANFRPDARVHSTVMDKNSSLTEKIDFIINSDPQRSLQNFFVYVVVKRVKNSLLDVQKFNIAYSPCFTLADFLKPTNDQQQSPIYSFDLFQDQSLRTHVGKLGIRLGILAYSDYQYVSSLPSGFYASKAFSTLCMTKGQKVSALLALTEKVKKWLNSYSSFIKVIEISNAHDGKELAQVVLYQKL